MPAQLTDFADPDSPTVAMATEPGTILGTVGYMSPEQVRGQPADARADIFSFGVILYEMVTGQRAFQAGSAVETMMAILRENPAPIPPTEAQSSSLERIIFRCMEKSPGERFQSARDVAYALDDLLAGSPERLPRAATQTSPTPSPGKRSGSSGGLENRRSGVGESGESSGYWLIFRDREVPLREGETILGRGREARIRLGEKGISRQHARILIRDGAASIEDLESKNGTFVRGARIEKPAPLVHGDEIRLGTLSMIVQFAPKTASTESNPP
jgi:serine/threonine protein kinase